MYRVCDHDTDLPGTTEGNIMIELAVDAILYILLLAAIGFGWISVIGLLLFPDIRSRAFTGIRAGIIAVTLVTASAICYGLFTWTTDGGMQYMMLVLAAVLMLVIVVALNRVAADAICRNAIPAPSQSGEQKDRQ
jgi:multicomponent Na+:H+ antiporter subunit G